MGFRFRKSIKIAPGVRLNVGTKSVGVSVGGKGARISTNTRTGTRATVGIPGTGISYTEKIGGSSGRSARRSTPASNAPISTQVAVTEKILELIVACPHCQASNDVPSAHAHHAFRCGGCSGVFRVEG